MPKGTKELLDAMNEALSEELASIIQYLYHHIQARGMDSAAIGEVFKQLSMVEMNHAYKLAERIDLLGGAPTTAIGPIRLGGDLKKMLDDNLQAEYEAIEMYQRLVALAEKENDPVTRRLMEDILGDTEEHADKLENLLGKK